jgi:hypothetical protein
MSPSLIGNWALQALSVIFYVLRFLRRFGLQHLQLEATRCVELHGANCNAHHAAALNLFFQVAAVMVQVASKEL